MDNPDPAFWLSAVALVWTIGLNIYILTGNDRRRIDERVNLLHKDLNGLGERLARTEERLTAMPKHGDLGAIHEKVNLVNVSLSSLQCSSEYNKQVLSQIYKHLIEVNKSVGTN